MPRYFFNVENSVSDIDYEGTELSDDDAARRQAVIFAGEHLRHSPSLPWDGSRLRVEVRAEDGPILLNVVITAEVPGGAA